MSHKCDEIHKVFNSFKRHKFPFDKEDIPKNGIYILFEKGETAHGGDRIVRVGTHTGDNQLRSRLNQHFLKQNKDRSIFRKNIGRALLNKNGDDYLQYWEFDLTSRENKVKYSHLINKDYQQQIEDEVTKVINNQFSFVVIEENDKDARLSYESKLVSEISNCNECSSSPNWLGMSSTKDKIKDSGLWQLNELYKEGFTESQFSEFKQKL